MTTGILKNSFRWILQPEETHGGGFTLSEWELRAAGLSDYHPHVEVNVVLDGELHVEVNGITVVAHPGDTVLTPPGVVGRYWAPAYARMLGIYGQNAHDLPSEYLEYWEIR